ncbi:hypothetical protein [Streptomyces sp. NPDC057280]|uniref:hypothetical protein n=1 Tax=Streptomyces sp. NPDC057280 TaxID=3346081 RepID=UPI003628C4FD
MTYYAALITELTEHRPDVVELAGCLSLALSVDRAFLRRARLRFLPRTTAGVEAELWFSPLVETAGRQALLLDPEAAEYLRVELARQKPELLREIRAFTATEHVHAPLVVRLYEDLLWSGLDPAGVEEAGIDRQAERILRAVSGQGASASAADDMGRWVLHYAHRVPDRLLRRDTLWSIQVAACERLGLEPPEAPLRAEITARARACVQEVLPVGVTVRSDGIVLSRPPAPGARLLHAGGTRHKVRLDVRGALSHTNEPIRLELPAGQSVHLPFTVVQRLGPDGGVRMTLSHPGTARDIAVSDHLGSGPGAAHCAVLLPDGTIVLHDGDGAENGRIPADGPQDARSRVLLSADGSEVSYLQYGEDVERLLAPGSRYIPALPRELQHSDQADGSAPFPASARIAQAYTDGRITVAPREGGSSDARVIGQVPWRVSCLAVSDDERWVAAVGNDSLLLELPVGPGLRPRETRLAFCATWVSACSDGSWVVVGHGGPVELHTEDGSGYHVVPDLERAADTAVPAWSVGRVLVEADEQQVRALRRLPGVECLLIRPRGMLAEEAEGFTDRLTALRRGGVRVVVGIDLAGLAEEDVLGVVRRWLDEDVDGLAFAAGAELTEVLLDDVRHLADGYDDRLLVWDHEHGGPHVAPAASLVSVLGFALRSRTVPGAFDEAMAQLRSAIASIFANAEAAAFQWGLVLSPAVPAAQRSLAAATLLSLPGCPVLPGDLVLQENAHRLSRLLELRRNHLALRRGGCDVVDVGTPNVLAVLRRYQDDVLLCLVNVAQTPAQAVVRTAETTRLQDAFDSSLLPAAHETTVLMYPGAVRWFRLLTP